MLNKFLEDEEYCGKTSGKALYDRQMHDISTMMSVNKEYFIELQRHQCTNDVNLIHGTKNRISSVSNKYLGMISKSGVTKVT